MTAWRRLAQILGRREHREYEGRRQARRNVVAKLALDRQRADAAGQLVANLVVPTVRFGQI